MSKFVVTDYLFFAFMQIVVLTGHVLQSEKQHIEEFVTSF